MCFVSSQDSSWTQTFRLIEFPLLLIGIKYAVIELDIIMGCAQPLLAIFRRRRWVKLFSFLDMIIHLCDTLYNLGLNKMRYFETLGLTLRIIDTQEQDELTAFLLEGDLAMTYKELLIELQQLG